MKVQFLYQKRNDDKTYQSAIIIAANIRLAEEVLHSTINNISDITGVIVLV